MSSIFRVLEVFRLQQRKGPILVGRYPSVEITIGTRLVSVDNGELFADVVAIDIPNEKAIAENQVALIVQPDLGTAFRAGADFCIVNPDQPGAEGRANSAAHLKAQ